MFFTRKKNKDALIYPSVNKQSRHDNVKNFVASSKIYKRNIKNLKIDEQDVNLYLSYTFSRYSKEINDVLENFQSELQRSKNRINARNEYIDGKLEREVFNKSRDEVERKNLMEMLSIINKKLLINTPFLDLFREQDNSKAKIFERSRFKQKFSDPLKIARDKVMDSMMPRDMLPQMVFEDLSNQMSEYIVENHRFPTERNIESDLIEKRDIKEFIETVRKKLFFSQEGINKFFKSGRIEDIMTKEQKKEFIELVDVFVPGEAGIDENTTIELIAKSMVWNNRLAKVAGGVHCDVVRNLAQRPTTTGKLAEALDDVYEELQQKTTRTKDGKYSTVLEDFINDYTDFLEDACDEETLRKFYSTQSVFKAVHEHCENKGIMNPREFNLQSMYEYLASRNAESFLYYAKDYSINLLIDEIAKKQRLGINAVKLSIGKDPDVEEDKVGISVSIRGKNGRYSVHGIKKSVDEIVNKKQNRNFRYNRYEQNFPIDFSIIYSLSPKQQIQVLHLLAEKDVKPLRGETERQKQDRENRVKMLTFYVNDILNEIRAKGTEEEIKKINDIAGTDTFYKLVMKENNSGSSLYNGEMPRSMALRKEMLKILYDREKSEKDRIHGK